VQRHCYTNAFGFVDRMLLLGTQVEVKDLSDAIVNKEHCRRPYTTFESRTVTKNLNRVRAFNVFYCLKRSFLGAANVAFEGGSVSWATSDSRDGFYIVGRDVGEEKKVM
jgi:hypothetical protein